MQRKWKRRWQRLVKHIVPQAMAGMLLFSAYGIAYANPEGGTVTAGSAAITTSGSTMTVNQITDKVAINWQSFSIAGGETVNFIQPNSTSIALNRVIGNNASSIYGNLNANGQVFLINPNGVLFSSTAQVNVGGLAASTLNLSDSDFMNGNYKFSGEGGSVTNQGTITAANGGYVALLGSQVTNEGVIVAQQGTVALAAGNAVTLDLHGDGLLSLAVDQAAVNAGVANHKLIKANGGTVIMTAKTAGDLASTVVNNTGVIEAQSMGTVNGVIRLDGGTGGTVVNSGTLDASGKNAGETGGTVKVLGQTVTLADGSSVDVSGDAGGGTALIGGNYQGKGTEQNAKTTTVAATAAINADAVTSGNGGKVVVWADGTTNYYGTISAKGGSVSGDGGSAEVSGQQTLLYKGYTDLRATKGTTGNLLLDPGEYTISTDPTGGNMYNVTDLANQLGAANVTLATDGTGTGNITVAAGLTYTSAHTLTLQANNDINVNAGITNSGSGAISLKADNNVNVNNTITSNGGNVTLRADSDANSSGTVAFDATNGKVVTDGAVSIYYNPGGTIPATINGTSQTVKNYTSPTDYSSYVKKTDNTTAGNLTAYMLVNSLKELQAMSVNVSGTYALGGDIDAGATSTWNGGAGFAPISSYTGTFDGDGHVISGLYNNGSKIGLFFSTQGPAAIRNVGLEDVNMTIAGGSRGGALVGTMGSGATVTNCYATGTIKGGIITNGQITDTAGIGAVGGLVGFGPGTITDSHSAVSLRINTSTNNLGYGGLFGGGLGGDAASVTNCYSTGTVDVTFTGVGQIWVGGLAGTSGSITNSYNTGAVTLTSTKASNTNITMGRFSWRSAGGLVGAGNGAVTNCYSTGSVTVSATNAIVGGLAGKQEGNVSNSYSTGLIQVTNPNTLYTNYTGGLVGYLGRPQTMTPQILPDPPTITDSYWDMGTSGITDPTQGAGNIASRPGVTGLTTDQAFTKAGYSWFDASGNSTDWYMIDGYTRPFLRSEYSTNISNAHQLQLMAMDPAATYTLAGNLDLSGLFTNAAGMWNTTGFVPVGNQSAAFSGSLDGGGYTITGMTINSSALSALGLFGYTTTGANIHDIGLIDASITGGANNTYVGSLVGYNGAGSTITSAYSYSTGSGAISGTGSVGGLAGANAGTIQYTYSAAPVSGGTAGGLVGDGTGGTIIDSVWDTTVSGQTQGVGSAAGAAGVTGLTTTEMADRTKYPGSWNFSTTWAMVNGRPHLQREYNGALFISSLSDLLSYFQTSGADLGGTYILGADITGIGAWTPVGTDTTPFTGKLLGYGYTLSGLTISSASPYVGLFGYTQGATISGLNLSGVSITAGGAGSYVGGLVGFSGTGTNIASCTSAGTITASGANNYVGGLAGYNGTGASIASCTSAGTVTASGVGSYVGGLVGYNTGTLESSINAAAVTASGANSRVGGLVGLNTTDGSILSSYNTGTLTSGADSNIIGGLAGENDGSISNSYNSGAVTTTTDATNNKVGGLIGKNNGSITSLYNTGAVTASGAGSTVGGLVGETASGNITSSYNTGAVTGNGDASYVGGLVGETASGAITGSYNTGAVTGNGGASYVGGLAGKTASGGITSSYNTGAVTGSGGASYVGGLAGGITGGNITSSYNIGAITGNGDGSYVGGLAGRSNAAVTSAYNTGKVTAGGAASYVGGLAGENTAAVTESYSIGKVIASGTGSYAGGLAGSNTATGAITGSFSASSVTTNGQSSYTGGLVGSNAGSINNSYSMIKTSASGADSHVGGLAGTNTATGTITDSYSVGAVTASGSNAAAGGLVGSNAGSITGAFWCTTTSGMDIGIGSDATTTSGVQGLTWDNMFISSNFSNWNTSAWGLVNGYLPYLTWQYSSTPSQVYTGTVEGGSGEIVNVYAFVGREYDTTVLVAQGYEFGVDGFWYGVNGTGLLPIVEYNQSMVQLSVTNDSDYKANGIYRATSSGLAGGNLIKDTLIVDGGDTTLTVGHLGIGCLPEDMLYSYSTTVDGNTTVIVNGNLVGNNFSTIAPDYQSWYGISATGDITIHTPGDFQLNSEWPGYNQRISAGGDINIMADGNIILLRGDFTPPLITAGGDITLVAGTGFVSTGGPSALSSGGRWLVYAPDKMVDSSKDSSNFLLYFYGKEFTRELGVNRLQAANSIHTDLLVVDATDGLTGDFTLWGTAYGDRILSIGSGFIFSSVKPTSRLLTPIQALRQTAVDLSHAENVQNWGSPISPVTVTDLDEAALFVNIINGGVRLPDGDN